MMRGARPSAQRADQYGWMVVWVTGGVGGDAFPWPKKGYGHVDRSIRFFVGGGGTLHYIKVQHGIRDGTKWFG